MATKEYTVYMHVCPNGKRYIGITFRAPEVRWQNGTAYRRNPHFNNAIIKYGWDNIDHVILLSGLKRIDATRMEQIFIATFRSNKKEYGYNNTVGGDGSKGWIPTSGTLEKMSIAHSGEKNHFYGKTHSEEALKKMRDARAKQIMPKGRKLSEDAKRKIGDANKGNISYWKGKRLPDETKVKLSKARKELCKDKNVIKMMREVSPTKKKVYQYNIDGSLIKIWDSRHQAENEFRIGKKSQAISKCCIGNCNIAYGFYWSYTLVGSPIDVPQSLLARNVYQYDEGFNLIAVWDNLNTAVCKFREGVKSPVIRQNVCGMRNKAYGYIWSYEPMQREVI